MEKAWREETDKANIKKKTNLFYPKVHTFFLCAAIILNCYFTNDSSSKIDSKYCIY